MSLKWKAPLDPVEVKDYVLNWEDEMTETTDTIATSLFELPPEAITDGLAIASQTGTTLIGRVWFHVPNAPDQETILGKGPYDVEHTITTAGGRTLNVSAKLRIADK